MTKSRAGRRTILRLSIAMVAAVLVLAGYAQWATARAELAVASLFTSIPQVAASSRPAPDGSLILLDGRRAGIVHRTAGIRFGDRLTDSSMVFFGTLDPELSPNTEMRPRKNS
jgi:hypothetical protein